MLGSGELGDDQIPLYLVDRISFAGANPGGRWDGVVVVVPVLVGVG